MVEDGELSQFLTDRYKDWSSPDATRMLSGELDLVAIYQNVKNRDINPRPKSGKQEYLENVVNRFL